jgi:predicted ATPase/DNA-binding CsgD family transcriptional regulator
VHHLNYVIEYAEAATDLSRQAEIRPGVPEEPNSFVGRERELDELSKLVRFTTRMLTLSGPGGIGKTRLALRTLHSLAEEFPDGVCFVELADIANPDLVVAAVASAVGVTEEQGRPLLDTLAEALRPRRMLLAIDNCEHLVEASARVCHRLLASAPGLRLLATSREPLRIAGETVWPVPPLSVGPQLSDAVRLFSERAMAALPSFTLVDNAGPVAELCRRLDGMPLAIELAAARIRALSVPQILDRLTDRFGLLTTGERAAPPRQRTLRAAIDWSHSLLTEGEQVLLRRLSVFAGWSLEMAELVCADPLLPAPDTLDLLAALVDKSLLVREPDALGQARYRMLDTIREYAAERLAAAGETDTFRANLRDYVLTEAEGNFAVGMALAPGSWPDRVRVFRRYDLDASNAWLVLSQCLADGDLETGLRITTAIRPCMLVRGEYAQGAEWIDAFLAAPGATAVAPAVRGAALVGRAQLTTSVDPAAAEVPARTGLELCRAAGDAFWTAAGLNVLSEICAHIGRVDEAESLVSEALSIATAARDGWNKGWALGIRAVVAGLHGNMRAAAELGAASISVMRDIEHYFGVARAQLGLADVARLRGDHGDARARYLEALTYLREVDARPDIARCLSGLGRVAIDTGAPETAREYLTESLYLSRATGSRIGVARGLEAFAALAVSTDDSERAALLAAAASALRTAAGLAPLSGARAARYLAPARRHADTVAADLWTRGLALSPEAAINLALAPNLLYISDMSEMGEAEIGEPEMGREQVTAVPPPASLSTALPTALSTALSTALPPALTPRELEIADLVASGHSNKAIASELFISPATVARHIANIMAKLGFRTRTQIATWTLNRAPDHGSQGVR